MVFAEIKTQPSGFHDSTSLCFIQTIGSGSSPDSWPFLPGYLYQNIHALFVLKFHTHVMVLSLVHFVFLDLLRRVTTNIWLIYSSFRARQICTETLVLPRVYLFCWIRGLTFQTFLSCLQCRGQMTPLSGVLWGVNRLILSITEHLRCP